MKEIKELFYQPTYIGVDLTDAIGSLVVYLLDGTLKFQEGWGKDRIEKAALGGENVDKFEIESVNSDGVVQIIIQYRAHYKAQEETRRHLIGTTKDKEKAEAWVATANKIYEENRRM